MTRVLVTGGAGTLGAAVVRRLLRDPDYEVRVSGQRAAPSWMREGCEVHRGDLRVLGEARKAFAEHRLPNTICRPCNAYGLGARDDAVIPSLLSRALAGETTLAIPGSGEQALALAPEPSPPRRSTPTAAGLRSGRPATCWDGKRRSGCAKAWRKRRSG